MTTKPTKGELKARLTKYFQPYRVVYRGNSIVERPIKNVILGLVGIIQAREQAAKREVLERLKASRQRLVKHIKNVNQELMVAPMTQATEFFIDEIDAELAKLDQGLQPDGDII